MILFTTIQHKEFFMMIFSHKFGLNKSPQQIENDGTNIDQLSGHKELVSIKVSDLSYVNEKIGTQRFISSLSDSN